MIELIDSIMEVNKVLNGNAYSYTAEQALEMFDIILGKDPNYDVFFEGLGKRVRSDNVPIMLKIKGLKKEYDLLMKYVKNEDPNLFGKTSKDYKFGKIHQRKSILKPKIFDLESRKYIAVLDFYFKFFFQIDYCIDLENILDMVMGKFRLNSEFFVVRGVNMLPELQKHNWDLFEFVRKNVNIEELLLK